MVCFHVCRDTGDEDASEYVEHRKLYDRVLINIKELCKSINQVCYTLNCLSPEYLFLLTHFSLILTCLCTQKLLLEELNLTRTCNTLLVPEADEDVRWANDQMLGVKDKPRAEGTFIHLLIKKKQKPHTTCQASWSFVDFVVSGPGITSATKSC